MQGSYHCESVHKLFREQQFLTFWLIEVVYFGSKSLSNCCSVEVNDHRDNCLSPEKASSRAWQLLRLGFFQGPGYSLGVGGQEPSWNLAKKS